uniref:SBP-type domain-containing protein n=1 Tax=Fagus sylvatica TaxID=28930 RepID=A0A2N9I8L7_FAGSY
MAQRPKAEWKCQADECFVDLQNSSHDKFNRLYEVCTLHAKSSKVTVQGKSQRFCSGCKRFHELTEFKNNKRTCNDQSQKMIKSQNARFHVLEEFDLRKRSCKRALKEESSKVPKCQVDGCGVELKKVENKVCAVHSRVRSFRIKNKLNRFCVKCSSFHVLKEFDLRKRSCKRALKEESSKVPKCQVDGCGVELQKVENKVCAVHSRATSVRIKNESNRFCLKGSRFHVLEKFNLRKRSCKRALKEDSSQVPKCHVDNCGVEVLNVTSSLLHGKVCKQHSRATWVWIQMKKKRYCQKCNTFHVLKEFNYQKSCRKTLKGLRERPQDSANKNSSKAPKKRLRELPKAAEEIEEQEVHGNASKRLRTKNTPAPSAIEGTIQPEVCNAPMRIRITNSTPAPSALEGTTQLEVRNELTAPSALKGTTQPEVCKAPMIKNSTPAPSAVEGTTQPEVRKAPIRIRIKKRPAPSALKGTTEGSSAGD